MNPRQSLSRPTSRLGTWCAALAAAAWLLAGCAAPQATSSETELPFDQAVAKVTDSLVAQTQKLPMPAFLAKLAKRGVVVDPMIDAATGEQTQATQTLERRVNERLTKNAADLVDVLPFQSANLARAQYLLTGTMARAPGGRKTLRINLALTELKTGNVVAQSSGVAKDEGLDHTPLPFYVDSPVLVKDKVIDGYITTTSTAPGQHADSYYMERIAVATVIADANTLYNAEKYQEALGQYRAAGGTSAGDQLRVLDGIYLSTMKLGRTAEAEQAFGRVVAYGIANNQLGVKFLFNPGSTVFWSDPKVSGPYTMWLRQIAKESSQSKSCMNVVGHTSRTGSEPVNDALSMQRATFIRQRLAAESAELNARTKPLGMGFRENIVGSGTDNAADALDRRVEFKIVPCG